MSKLNEKTNFELNVLVAMHEHPELAKHPDDMISECKNGRALFEWPETFTDDYCQQEYYNYTGDWAQMGPIIEREKINVFDARKTGEWMSLGDTGKESVSSCDKSPLRAAAICYLMMKEAES